MNKMLKGLLVALLAVSAAEVTAHTNKTFLMPRSQGVNLPMEYTTFTELVGRKSEDKFGGNFQVTVFGGESTKNNDIAKYFLFNNKTSINLPVTDAGNGPDAAPDLALGYLIHNIAGVAADNNQATLSLDPRQSNVGVRLDYHQDLDKILKGLYLYANLPIAHVENDPRINVTSSGTAPNFPATRIAAGTPSVATTVANYFNGTYSNAQLINAQSALSRAKIAGKQSETGVADIDIGLGYKFLRKEKYHAALAIAVTIPTGNEAKGNYMFEPIVGNGTHFGLGFDFCAGARVWGDMDHNVKIHLMMKYRYLFESDETRTLGLQNRKWGQYLLLVKAGQTAQSLIPAANITTLNVKVTPGSQFDGILGFAYNNGGLTWDIGYNLYAREEEDIKLKAGFANNTYAIASTNFAANTNLTGLVGPQGTTFIAGAGNVGVADGATATTAITGLPFINTSTLDTGAASTPSQVTHSIYTALGYVCKEWEYPLMFGIGGKYEFTDSNSALEQWGLWGKLGVGF